MPGQTVQIKTETAVGGRSFRQTRTVTGDNVQTMEPSAGVPAFKTGTLTTRTDNTTGTLTMANGHGISTGDKIDIYWGTDGTTARVNVTVGTVSGNSVPFSVGSGTNLPAATTPVVAGTPASHSIAIPTATVDLLAASGDDHGRVTLFNGSTLLATLSLDATNGDKYLWDSGNGVTVPIASDVTAVKFSHLNTTAAQTMSLVALN